MSGLVFFGKLTLALIYVKKKKTEKKTKPASAGFPGQIDFTAPSTLVHLLRSSKCSTSLDSSTTLPLTMVCVTTFTIFLVLTSGSSVIDIFIRIHSSHDCVVKRAEKYNIVCYKCFNVHTLNLYLLFGGGGVSFILEETKHNQFNSGMRQIELNCLHETLKCAMCNCC